MADYPTLNHKYDIPKWDDSNPKSESNISKIICGTKYFDLTIADKIVRCANELTCRRYLNEIKFTHMSTLCTIEPEEVKKIYDAIDPIEIGIDFFSERNRVIDKLKKLKLARPYCKMNIEIGETIDDHLRNIALDCKNNEQNALKIIDEIFEILSVLEKNHFVHSDLKQSNFLMKVVDGEETIVLNDFDASFVLPERQDWRIPDCSKNEDAWHTLPAPEIYKKEEKKCRIGYFTDVYTAGLISYELLNEGSFPEPIKKVYDKCEAKRNPESKIQKKFLNYLIPQN